MWKTRGAKGTRSAFSWTATLTTLLAIVAIAFLLGREFGVLSKTPNRGEELHSWGTALESSTENVEAWESATVEDAANGEIVETSEKFEATESGETTETSENEAE